MIFQHLHIDGFGIWRDLTLDDIDPGLNVFVAPNEGGKTTLMTFVRSVLYGFRRRNHPERYEPLRGGKHGGFLEVLANGGSYRLARTDDGSSAGALQISDGNGEPLPEDTLARLLSGTTRELYENVFAFGLTELQKLETLGTDEIAAHIYSAGMAATGIDPIGFRRDVEDARRRLFLPKGKKQAISELMTRVQLLQREIEELQQLPEEHATLLKEAESLRARLHELDGELERRQSELDADRRARSAWGDYEELLGAESALEALGVPLERADAAEATDLLSERERAVIREAGRIRSLLAGAPRLRELRAAVVKHRSDADTAESALESHLQDLGKNWSVDRILATRTGLEQREGARGYAEKIRDHEAEIDSIAARASEAHDAYEVVVGRRDPVSREAVMATWGIAAALAFLSAILVPLSAKLLVTSAVGATGAVAGIVMLWLRYRGIQQLGDERLASADRETTLWAQHEVAEKEVREHQTEWRNWLEQEGLEPELTLDGALDLLDRVREAQEVARKREAAAAAAEKAVGELSVACGRVNALLQELGGETEPLGDRLLEAVEPLLGQLETLQAELDSVEDQHLRLRQEMQQYVQARAAVRAGSGEEGPVALRARLEQLDPDQIQRMVEDAEAAVGAVRAQRDGVNEQLGSVAERMSHVESDGELGRLLMEREQARAELVALVRTWAGHTATGSLFDKAKGVYEEQRQPIVLRLASDYFNAMTGGRYARVLAPLGEARCEIEESKSGSRKGPEALSRGTAEQLYLSMRLALASVYAEQAVALPLVADDILVNFDDARAKATAALLGTYAVEGSQVLAFTCHSYLAEVFREQAPEARIVELPKPA